MIFTTIMLSSLAVANPYEKLTGSELNAIKKVQLPFEETTSFEVSQGAFGKRSHQEKGNEYSWDLAVPINTKVLSVEAGKVLQVFEPNKGGRCDSSFSNLAHNLKIEHRDGTVAQYVHVESKVKLGDRIEKGQIIATTAINGWICRPHLHFSIYKSSKDLYDSPTRKTLAVFFRGVPGGLLKTGYIHKAKQ